MANPTLVTNVPPWAGFTRTTIHEALLKSRGMTLDSTTGRMVAIASEQSESLDYLRRAFGELNITWPNTFQERTQSATWTADDSQKALADDVGTVLSVRLGGVELRALSRDDYLRLRRSDDQGGGVGADGEDPAFYRIVGTTAANLLVLEIMPTPSAADTLEVDYISLPPSLPDASPTAVIRLWPHLAEWLLHRAKEIWAAETGDTSLSTASYQERMKVEKVIDNWLEGTKQYPLRVRWKYPNQTARRGRRFPRG